MATSIPKSMKGVIIEKTGGVEVLDYRTDVPVPIPKAGEILVKNDFVGVNYIDTYFRTGLYQAPKPEILGRDGEGTVVAVVPVDPANPPPFHEEFKPGDRVVWMATGGYAEYTAMAAYKAAKIPSFLKPGQASAAILQGLTALTMTEESHKVVAGEWILVHAAAGGVGLWLCQILKAKGAHVIATAGTEEKRQLALKNGAEVCVGYEEEELLKVVNEKTNGQGVHAVFDGVGKSTWATSLKAVRRKGMLASFGNASGAVPPVTLATLTGKNVKICRPTLFNYLITKEEWEYYTSKLWKLIGEEKMDVHIHKTYDMKDVQQAHLDLEGRKTTGKLMMKP